jgi:nitroreductase
MEYQKILEAAICAPSGDNCQPWRFKAIDNRIEVHNVPEKDTSLFNFRQRASLIAHGALLENIRIASSAEGFQARTTVFPDTSVPNHIATIEFHRNTTKDEPLYPFIPLRTTNRKRYQTSPLTEDARSALLSVKQACEKCLIKLVEESREKEMLARIAGTNDRLVFENPHLHAFLYGKIRWTDQEAEITRDGLDIKTLEVSGVDAIGFRLFRNYSLLKRLNTLGVSRMVGKNAEKLAASAAAIGMIAVPGSKNADYLMAGIMLQRLWLEATRLNLGMQLMTGITFLMQRVRENETEGLTAGQIEMLRSAYEEAKLAGGFKDETIALMFRIGKCGPPSARSLRVPLEHLVTA